MKGLNEERTLDSIEDEIDNTHDTLLDEWIDYLPRILIYLPKFIERDIPVIGDRVCAKKTSFGAFWSCVEEHVLLLDRYRQPPTRLEVESYVRDPQNWELYAAGMVDGHSLYLWRFKLSATLGAITLVDREDNEVHVRLRGV